LPALYEVLMRSINRLLWSVGCKADVQCGFPAPGR
jgi:hypothetical protein